MSRGRARLGHHYGRFEGAAGRDIKDGKEYASKAKNAATGIEAKECWKRVRRQ